MVDTRLTHWLETLALNSEENAPKNTAKPWFSNRQLSTGFGTMLTVVIGWGVEITMPSQSIVQQALVESSHALAALNRGRI
jgi:hypothetical protein